MSLIFNSNTPALGISRYLNLHQNTENTLIAQLSSGTRLVNASIDPSALAEANQLDAQQRSFDQAQRNASDAVSLTQVADGSLESIGGLLSQMRELAVE